MQRFSNYYTITFFYGYRAFSNFLLLGINTTTVKHFRLGIEIYLNNHDSRYKALKRYLCIIVNYIHLHLYLFRSIILYFSSNSIVVKHHYLHSHAVEKISLNCSELHFLHLKQICEVCSLKRKRVKERVYGKRKQNEQIYMCIFEI